MMGFLRKRHNRGRSNSAEVHVPPNMDAWCPKNSDTKPAANSVSFGILRACLQLAPNVCVSQRGHVIAKG